VNTQTAQYSYTTPSLIVSMNINQFSGLSIMVVMAVFVLTVTATSVIPAAIAQNMTGGNTTGGNTTGKISSLSICVLAYVDYGC